MKQQSKAENILYLALWALLFIVPVVVLFSRELQNEYTFQWKDLLHIWKQFCLFLAFFLFHNFFLAPILVHKQKLFQYIVAIIFLIAIFVTIQCANRPPIPEKRQYGVEMGPPPLPENLAKKTSPSKHELPPRGPQPVTGQRDVVSTIMLITMLGMNIGVKLYFRQRNDQKHMADMERENLEQQLQYLKYQINPHFLMNTLNNIHALVDIDSEQAKESIVQLSKILRFVLYEGAKHQVPLQRELLFTEDYLQLMRMRVTDKVDIRVEMPERIPDSTVPPLIFITFIENAFKHGVSYQQPSFIHISINVDSKNLFFRCENSKIPRNEDKHGGVGLANAIRRLSLIYGNRHTLDIVDNETYTVELTLPLSHD